jgi:integrase/recombinase XerD
LRYLAPPEHLSGRDLADKLLRGMEHIHARRIAMLTGIDAPATTATGTSR